MKEFNIYTMRGASAEDNEILMGYINQDMEDCLFVDESGRVFDASDRYVADCIEGEAGDGICC